jgi:hypothetical protein
MAGVLQPNAFWAPTGALLVFARNLGGGKVQLEMASARADWQSTILAVHASDRMDAPDWRPMPLTDLDNEDPWLPVYEPPTESAANH